MTVEAPLDRSGTRGRALAIALELFSRDGYDAVSMRDLADELGVSKAALYHHFSAKEEIARELIGSYLAAVDELVTWANTTAPALDALLERWAELVRTEGVSVSKFIHANPRLLRDLDLHGPQGPRRAILEVADTVAGPDTTPAVRMQVRMALACLHVQVIAAEGLDIDPDEAFRLALAVAKTMVHNAGL